MMRLRILADDLTGALDCAAAFGAGVPVHLGRPAHTDPAGIDIVATATRDVPTADLPTLLAPSLAWLAGADVAFKKVDSLLRGNTFEEVDWIARQGHFIGLGLAPAFPAQGRLTLAGQQWWQRPDGSRTAVAHPISQALQARGWPLAMGTLRQPTTMPAAWVPDVQTDAQMDAVAAAALSSHGRWLWSGSAGLAHALARTQAWPALALPPSASSSSSRSRQSPTPTGPVLLVSASHQAVSQTQWQVLHQSARAALCHRGDDPASLVQPAAGYPQFIDLSARQWLKAEEAAALLKAQTLAIAQHAPRPRTLVVVGGDTLLALCRATGAQGLVSATPLARPGWGSAHLVGGRWDGLVCHTRSGAFGGTQDLAEVLDALGA